MVGQFLVGLVRQPGGGVVSAGRQGPIPVDGTVWSLSGDRPGGEGALAPVRPDATRTVRPDL